MNGNDTNTKGTKMNANQKMILKDATKILVQLRKLGTKEGHKAADELNQRVARMLEEAAG
jgi:flagellar biosynthesis/type III secretory pathway protein FliH